MSSNPPEKSLVLVIGAGASEEANLPVGAELRKLIAKALDINYDHGGRMPKGDHIINDAFGILAAAVNSRRVDINPYVQAAWRIRDAMPQAISIDNFMPSPVIGKLNVMLVAKFLRIGCRRIHR